MALTSIEYLLFLGFVTFLFYSIHLKYRLYLLVITGYYFYTTFQVSFSCLLFLMSCFVYFAGFWVSKKPKNKFVVPIILIIVLLPLLYFKYFNFVSENINSFGYSLPTIKYAFPIGISFFTFQMISYLIDIKRGFIKPETNFGKVLLHHAFFPILLAGPIERSRKLMNQFDFKMEFDYENVRNAMVLITWGLFKKIVIANSLGFYVNTIYKNVELNNGLEILLAMWFFVFQIIVDFSAYNDIAMGSAKIFGIKITKNIHDRAYSSTSRTQLWQRWHISLTDWLRDYIFFPLSKFSKSEVWLYCNILIVYLISGFWHGAAWGFIFWGLGNGIWLIIEQISKKSRFVFFERIGILKFPLAFNFMAWLIFFNASAVFDVFFISDDLKSSSIILNQIFVIKPFAFLAGKRVILIIFLSLFMLETINRIKEEKEIYEILPQNVFFRWSFYVVLVLAAFYLKPWENASFYYFKF